MIMEAWKWFDLEREASPILFVFQHTRSEPICRLWIYRSRMWNQNHLIIISITTDLVGNMEWTFFLPRVQQKSLSTTIAVR